MAPRSKETNNPNEMQQSEQHTNTIEEEPVPEETATTDIGDAWAMAEGYTPLSDLNHDGDGGLSYVMVSTGPSDSSSDSDEARTTMQATTMQAPFYVNPNVFGTDMNINSHTDGDTTLNFDEIAASALSALDEEYQQTQMEPQIDSLDTKQDDEDLKIIAAGFDERNQELKEISRQGGFVCQQQWDEKPQQQRQQQQQQKQKQQQQPNVDTDAIRKAVETLTVKNKNNPFQQKFAAWQHKQKLKRQQEKEEEPHKLIPTSTYNLFQESNPSSESRLASANFSRSATLAEALLRLSLLPRDNGNHDDDDDDDFLLIDIVGVDHVECESKATIRNTFRPLVQWLGDYILATNQNQTNQKLRVHFRLIGRELFTTTNVVDLMDTESPSTQSSHINATATCHSGVYHEFLEEILCEGGKTGDPNEIFTGDQRIPDLAVAFNAGIWGYREWAETIQYLALQDYAVTAEKASKNPKHRGCSGLPMVITAYTLDECQEDQEVISQSLTVASTDTIEETDDNDAVSTPRDSYRAEILWESEPNPFGSKVVRETKGSTQEYRENACWQAWILGGRQ